MACWPGPPLSNLPAAAGEHGDLVAVAGHAADLQLRRADHEVDVDVGHVELLAGRLVGREEGEGAAERDVRGGVLVDQGVVEDGVEGADAALAVDQGDLAEALRLPTFGVEDMTLYRRITLVAEDGAIAKVFYPVFPPDRNAADVVAWLSG